MTDETAAPALGYSILANLGDEKQLTVQCFVDSEDDIDTIHGKVDRAMAVVDRQKAKYRLKDLRKEVEEMEAGLARQEDDLARLETQFETNQAALDERIRELLVAREDVQKRAFARGRSAPVGAEKATFTNTKKEIEQLTEEKAKAITEREAARSNMAVNVGRFRDAIAKKSAEIAECEALVSDGG